MQKDFIYSVKFSCLIHSVKIQEANCIGADHSLYTGEEGGVTVVSFFVVSLPQ